MSLMVSPIVDEFKSIEHRLRVAEGERRYHALAALASASKHGSRGARLQTRLGDALIAAGNRLRGVPRLDPAAA